MDGESWLVEARESYDTVAASYTDLVRSAVADQPLVRASLAFFVGLVRGSIGPVVDMGCGPGHFTAHLQDQGLDAFGIDLSPAMITIARREHPGLRFEVGSMTDPDLPDSSVAGVLAFYSVIHVPDEAIPGVLRHFHRILRPDGVALLGFHVGDEHRIKTEGYGGHRMNLPLDLRPMDRMTGWLRDAGFGIEAQILLEPDAKVPGGIVVARRSGISAES
ncbi:SAM-dependent methyltransferase [Nakamurella sp. UYEF19]|uniref:class I SAM-dependent methyltransferase n=1 Tax=Nakamurella sp. UYEF19 TaxID=1756392 RepID=UPI00339A19FE